ncbi:acriflavine resistance protein B [Gammaproteobacteria bacterium ESL0073]|nr:acriflavine resistance protein B [Gammaproteobacteria bacterium ESL0073]
MKFSNLFISRPIATILLTCGLMLLGIVAYFQLPIAPLPQVDLPTIQVTAKLSGASAEAMATSVATPLERAFASVQQVTSMTSSSSLGVTQITLQFDLSRNIDAAAQDVQTAINTASGKLPKDMTNPPTFKKVNPAEQTFLSIALTSKTRPLAELDTYADNYIAQQLSEVPGVGIIDFHGEQRPAVRVRIDPDKLATHGLTLEEIRSVINNSTVNIPKGTLYRKDQTITLDTTDQIMQADQYNDLIIAYKDGAPIRIKDVGSAINDVEDTTQAAWLQGQSTVIADVHKQPGFNVLAVTEAIKGKLPSIIEQIPKDVSVQIVGDRTQTIMSAIDEVQFTLIISILLVVAVIFVFLRNLTATLIPVITIPLSLIMTFGVMYLLGYSLNNLSIMGLSIAVSFVVDDAIVVMENIMRHIEQGRKPMQAAIEGASEVSFTILSMTLSLVAVFIPIIFMSGVIGLVFREFAITVAIAILASGIISLTITPMLCSLIIKSNEQQVHGKLYQKTEDLFNKALHFYRITLNCTLKHRTLTMLISIITLIATISLYYAIPKSFFPQQDTGLIMGVAEAAPDVSLSDMKEKMQVLGNIIQKDTDVDVVDYWIGPNPTLSQGRFMINLKPYSERPTNANQIMQRIQKETDKITGIKLFMQVRQDLQIGGKISKTQYQYTLQTPNTDDLNKWSKIILDVFKQLPELQDITSDQQSSAHRITLQIDRDMASRLGGSVQDIDNTLYDSFGQRQVATLFTQLDQYYVILELSPQWQMTPDTLNHLYVKSSTSTELVPLSLLGKFVSNLAPITINHQGLFPSVTISFNLKQGYALSDAVTSINNAVIKAGKPDTISGKFEGSAQEFQKSLSSQIWLILAAILTIYIILGMLYESTLLPIVVISTLPSAGLGALLALIFFNQSLSIMGIIGILMLMGIVKKNAIMMVDFALIAELVGKKPLEAIRQGCLLRFRPIIMTTLAALFAAIPLAISSGAGAELRQPLGITIVGGLIVSQLLTLYTTPIIYLWIRKLKKS